MNSKLFPEDGCDESSSQDKTDGNWVMIHRKILKWEWYDDHNTTRLLVHLILRANWKPTKWRGITIERGQFLTSLYKLSKETGLTVRQIRTSLEKLKSTSELTIKATNRNRVITLCRYDTYQSKDYTSDKQNGKQDVNLVTSKRQASDKPSRKEGEEREEVKEEKTSAKRFVPPSIETWLDYARSIGFGKSDAISAYDHYVAVGWKVGGNPMKDWKAACRNCNRRSGGTKNFSHTPQPEFRGF